LDRSCNEYTAASNTPDGSALSRKHRAGSALPGRPLARAPRGHQGLLAARRPDRVSQASPFRAPDGRLSPPARLGPLPCLPRCRAPRPAPRRPSACRNAARPPGPPWRPAGPCGRPASLLRRPWERRPVRRRPLRHEGPPRPRPHRPNDNHPRTSPPPAARPPEPGRNMESPVPPPHAPATGNWPPSEAADKTMTSGTSCVETALSPPKQRPASTPCSASRRQLACPVPVWPFPTPDPWMAPDGERPTTGPGLDPRVRHRPHEPTANGPWSPLAGRKPRGPTGPPTPTLRPSRPSAPSAPPLPRPLPARGVGGGGGGGPKYL